MQIFERWGLHPQTPVPPAAGGFAPRPPKQPPIANFWLSAWWSVWQLNFELLPRNPHGKAGNEEKRKTISNCCFVVVIDVFYAHICSIGLRMPLTLTFVTCSLLVIYIKIFEWLTRKSFWFRNWPRRISVRIVGWSYNFLKYMNLSKN